MNFIDLSHPVTNGMPTYATDPDVSIVRKKNIDTERTLLHQFTMGTHTGTHLDVPAHIVNGGKNLNDFPIKAFSGCAVKVNNQTINKMDEIKVNIDGIIYDTGWYKQFHSSEIFYGSNRPSIPKVLVEKIIGKGIRIFGCDLPSVDASGSINKPIHHSLLGAEIIIYESLANLEKLPLLEPFDFFGFPLPLEGLDGSPVRAVGIIES